VLGKRTSADSTRNPSSLIFARSPFATEEPVQPTTYFFELFFAILLQWATPLDGHAMVRHKKVQARTSVRKKKKKKKKKCWCQRSRELVNSKSKRDFL
jgi:hypothetical protein